MKNNLWPITLTRKISDIHSGGFSKDDEKIFGFKEGELFEEPKELHELITFHKKNFAKNLELYKNNFISKNKEYKEIKNSVFAHESTQISEQAEFNTEKGIIIIEKNVHIMPFTYLVGPLRIDEGATVNPYTHILNSYIGKYSKVGGEITNTIFESYSNKAHRGFLGDSYVGSWVNIGGGTSVSNMKNNYENIKMNGLETGEQFLGCIIADHVKVALNVSIYCGKIIGINSHIYGTVTTDVPSFVNYISKDNMIVLPTELAIKIAERMQIRRDIKITEETKAMLLSIYKQTEEERKLCGAKEGKLIL
jgi:glucose-1-phosphate thymidylyltransferase